MSAQNIQPLVRLSRNDVAQVVNVLAQAFHHDPLWAYALSDPDTRRRALGRLFRITAKFAAVEGEVYATSANFEGVAVWVPPGRSMRVVDAVRLGWSEMIATLVISGPGGFRRIMQVLDAFEARQKEDAPTTRYWHLMQMGVLPKYQNRGFGSQLLAPVLGVLDQKHEACYLETETPENVEFYQKRGFEVVNAARIGDSGPTLWGMVRQPRP